jgi:hypothetical protein
MKDSYTNKVGLAPAGTSEISKAPARPFGEIMSGQLSMTRKKGIPKMTTPLRSVASRPAWKALEAHHRKIRELHLRKLFTDDPKRGERFATEAAGLYLD